MTEHWKKERFSASPIDTHLINEVTRYFFLSLPPREALRLALDNANALDQILANLDDNYLKDMATKGTGIQINRGMHRGSLLDEIEQAIQGSSSNPGR